MPHTVTNRGLYNFFNTAISGTTDLRAAVFKGSAPTVGAIKDMNFLSDLTALMTEAAAAGYSRQDLQVSLFPKMTQVITSPSSLPHQP